jgi:serine/threonine protein kinase/tetratricopeptide (TPR) repeat protein
VVIPNGTKLGPFVVVGHLGSGGMGHVYRARDTRLGRDVALKVLPPNLFDQEEWQARFQREAKIISNLNHPNILTIHEIAETQMPGVIGTTHYLVTEYIDGVTMREAMAKERDPSALLGRMAQVADALQKAHAAGIVHRDLKPDNIMFTHDGYAKVLDFGLAKNFQAPTDSQGRRTFQTQQGITVGTIGYMSPEQIQGKAVDHRADIFSFGCILYEMLTGKLPFEGETLIETLHAIVSSKPSAIPASIDYQLRQIVKRCLEKNVDARFQSMQEIAMLLRAAASPTGPAPRRASRPTSSSKNPTASSTRLRTLAIMPFANVNGDPEMEYLTDGITETIIYTLSQVRKRLRVLARSTVFAYKGKTFTPQQLAAEVGATSVVMGRVQRVGPSIVVTADLVNANDGTQVWGERFHRPLQDIFDLQDELATSISDQLRLKLTAGDRQRLVQRPTKRSEAYELFLKGRFYLNQRTPEALQRALMSFEEAVSIDRKYAQAWAGLAEVHTVLRSRALTRADDSCQRGEDAAQKAIELDPSLAEPRATLGCFAWIHRWKWNEADRLFRTAIRLDPHCVTARQWHSGLYVWLGMFDEARQEAKLAVDYEPLSLVLNLNYSGMLYVSGRLEEAMSVCRKVLELEPRFFFAHWMHGRILLARGLPSDAVNVLRAAVDDCGRHPELLGTLGYAYARSGKPDEALTILRELESTGTEARNAMHLGEVWLGLGDLEKAMHYIEQLFVRRGDLGVVLSSPEFRPLREHPAFAEMLKRVEFPARELHTSMPRTMLQSYADQT